MEKRSIVALCITGLLAVTGCETATPANTINTARPATPVKPVPSQSIPSTSQPLSVVLNLSAVKEDPNGAITHTAVPDVRFVVVDETGTVLGTRTGSGALKISVYPSGFWDSAIKSMHLRPVGMVEVLAYAPHMIDTIMVDTPVSNDGLALGPVSVPMMPEVNPKGRNTPNEPNIVLGTSGLHHLVIDGVSEYYSQFAHLTSSFLRNN